MTKPSKSGSKSGSDSGSKSGSASVLKTTQSPNSKAKTKAPEYEAKGQVVDIPWYDPRKRYTRETFRIGINHFLKLTAKNYSTFPLLLLNVVLVPVPFCWFQYYRMTKTTDVWSPNRHPHWDKYEHKHIKLNEHWLSKESRDNLKKEHPRPRFDWQYQNKPLKSKYKLPGVKTESSHKSSSH